MFFPAEFEKKVGFDIIKGLIKDCCYSNSAKVMVDAIRLYYKEEKINQRLTQAEEFVNILQFENPYPPEEFIDLTSTLSKYHIEGTFMEAEHLSMLRKNIFTLNKWEVFFKNHDEQEFIELRKLYHLVVLNKEIFIQIDNIIDDKDCIKDTASNDLFEIRKEIHKKNAKISGKIHQILTQLKKEDVLNESSELTVRNGRMVIPVPAANKRKIKGFIHDESASGQTVFIEPTEVFDLNNEIRELELQERREIVKILTNFTDFIRPYLENIFQNCQQLVVLDFIRAKAKLAIKINAIKPFIVEEKSMNWMEAVHPLLYLTLKNHKRQVVPLNISINSDKRILVISGPNAGGKSVCLKTIGLLQYMLQCGILIPLKHGSQCSIFENFFIDIGDEQSLEDDLSTYSSHLMNMKQLIDIASEKTLFLIDEFGAGTEPNIGGAIAEAVLESINEKKAYGVITTHYSNLKIFAEHTPGICNASMQYDLHEMKPLFKLIIDVPGSSFAFEIAKNIGLQNEVLLKAQSKIGIDQLNFDKQLQQLETEKIRIEKQAEKLAQADKFLAEIIEKYTVLNNELDDSKKYIINQAKIEAKNILNSANKIIEKTIKQIKEHNADGNITKSVRTELKDFSDQIIPEQINLAAPKLVHKNSKKRKLEKNLKENKIPIDNSEIFPGDFVRIIGQEQVGEVLEIKNKQIFIGFDSSTIRTKLEMVEKLKIPVANEKKKEGFSSIQYNRKLNFDLNEKMALFKATLDIRGCRAEEASGKIRMYLDEAILLNVPEIKIIHGKGDGILREILRNLLANTAEVIKFGDERLELGGSGATVISFR